MRILAINGSPRLEGHTIELLEAAGEELINNQEALKTQPKSYVIAQGL